MKARKMVATLAMAMAFVPAGAFAADLPSADEVISKYIDGIGGKAALDKIKNRVVKGKFSLPDMGIEATMTSFSAPPNSLNEVNVESMGMTVLRGMSDGLAWEVNPMQGARILEGPEKGQMVRQAALVPYASYKTDYDKVEVVAEENVGDKPAYKVVFTPKEGDAETVFFDKESGLAVQTEGMAEGMTIITTIGDYKEIDGVKVAHSITNSGGPMKIEITYESIEHNVDIPADKFALPAEIVALQNPPAAPADGAAATPPATN